ncbi:hypothetical protein [Acutalibacter intestini]|uniref:hypothetical protein n=1 Tax=Acutalibacter intestini TaxID=3093659 RepID=UPI002AC9E046|nr:hypothetical protein [Acutalibacter sp. M00204]
MNDYTDIIHMERPLSSHPKMDLGNRAKLFSSFDALRGFDLALLAKQVERQLTVRASLLDDAQELLDRKLHMVQPGTKVTITYFRMEKMIGDTEVGTYITETGTVEAIDLQEKAIVLSAAYIPCSDIIGLEGDDIPECAGEVEVNPYDGPD